MADRFISQLAADSNGPDVVRGDLVVVSRGGVDYKAIAGGVLFVPASTAADAGKTLAVDSTGVPAWSDSTTPPSITQLWSGNITAANGSTTTIQLDTGRSLADYDMITITYRYRPKTGIGEASTLVRDNLSIPSTMIMTSRPTTIVSPDSGAQTQVFAGTNVTNRISFSGSALFPSSNPPRANGFPEILVIYGHNFRK